MTLLFFRNRLDHHLHNLFDIERISLVELLSIPPPHIPHDDEIGSSLSFGGGVFFFAARSASIFTICV